MSEQGKRNLNNQDPTQGGTGKPVKVKKPKKKKHIIFRIIGFIFRLIGTLILIGMTTGALLACFGAVYVQTVIMPQTDLDLSNFFVGQNSVMYYTDKHTGQEVEMVTLLNTTSSIWKDYYELPQDLINATVAIEDKRFWEHPGVDWQRTGAAVYAMFTGGDIQGGSTLTQQLIKNLTTYDDVTVKRKVIEIFRAFELDSNYSKFDILTWYLNIIYLGEGNKGVGSASWEYFGKDVSELSLAECASLISITNNPSIYSPYGTYVAPHPVSKEPMDSLAWNKYRQEVVLYAMLDQTMISRAQYEAAVAEPLNFVRSAEEVDPTAVYTWFEEQVIDDVREDLISTYGYSSEAANLMLASGGLSIYTTIDQDVQAVADSVYQDWSNLNVPSANGQPLQSAITIIDNSTGDVVALVGQMGVKEQNLLHNFATEANRQPGSSIKPLSVYAPALDSGVLTPVSVVDDYPYQLINNSAWPINAYGYYRGMTALEFALEQSSNCIAVRIVGDLLTPEVSFDYMTKTLHFDTLVEEMESYGQIKTDKAIAPLALGGLTTGVNTRDMAEGYASFANQGIYTHSRTYTKVLDSNGEVILDNSPQKEHAMQATTAYYINDLLQGVLTSSGTASKANFNGMTIAGKTGTTNDDFDLWFVGYTPYYTAAVWTGYEYNEKINKTSAPAMTMWKNVMEPLHTDLVDVGFHTPDGLTSVSYCLDSGLLPGSYCSSDARGSRVASKMIYAEDAPTETCTAHGPGGAVSICTHSAVMDIDGNMSGYQLAGMYCPDYAISTQSYVVLDRVIIGGATARDSSYVYSGGGYRGTCTVHTADYVYGDIFDNLFPDYSVDTETPQVDEGTTDSGDSNTGDTGGNDSTTTTPDTSTGTTTPDTGTTTTPTPTPDDSGGIPGVTVPAVPTVPDVTITPEPTPEPTPTPTPTPEVVVPDVTTTPDTGIPGVGSTAIPGVG